MEWGRGRGCQPSSRKYEELSHTLTDHKWTFEDHFLNIKKINQKHNLHKKAIRIVYKDHFTSFNELSSNKSVTVHEKIFKYLLLRY